MYDKLLESSRRDDSNKWSYIGFGEELGSLQIKICILSGALLVTGKLYFSILNIYVCVFPGEAVFFPAGRDSWGPGCADGRAILLHYKVQDGNTRGYHLQDRLLHVSCSLNLLYFTASCDFDDYDLT